MEVVLKRTKITKSILNQLKMANWTQILNWEVLGFVNMGKYDNILFYAHNELVFMNRFSEFEDRTQTKTDDNTTLYRVAIRISTGVYFTDSRNENEHKQLLKRLQEIKLQASQKGQIYY